MNTEPNNTPQSSISSNSQHPIVQDENHRDSLNRVVQVLALLQHLDLQAGLSSEADAGWFWVTKMLRDSIQHVSDSLAEN